MKIRRQKDQANPYLGRGLTRKMDIFLDQTQAENENDGVGDQDIADDVNQVDGGAVEQVDEDIFPHPNQEEMFCLCVQSAS